MQPSCKFQPPIPAQQEAVAVEVTVPQPWWQVVAQILSTVVVGVTFGQQAAAQGTVVMVWIIQSATTQPVRTGQSRGFVDVEVGQ